MDQTPPGPSRSQTLVYDGRIGELYGIFLLNILFTILTIGIFRFWAITRYRRYFWSRMRFQGERFEYTGTGGQLFLGYLLAGGVLIGLVVVAFGAAFVLGKVWAPLAAIPLLMLYVLVALLAAGAIFSAQRYRLSRTLWCGIRGGMSGSALAYGVHAVLYVLLVALTLAQMLPWVRVRLAERRINASSFGNAHFSFHGRARDLYLPFLATLGAIAVLFVVVASSVWAISAAIMPQQPGTDEMFGQIMAQIGRVAWVATLGMIVFGMLTALVSCWYKALFERHVVGNTALGPVQFSSSMTGPGLCGLMIGNLLIVIVTLGLGYPIVLHRNARFLARTMWTEGTVLVPTLTQSTEAAPRFGEGMFQQLDATGGVF